MPDKTPITVAYGDGVGPEIMRATLAILEAAGAKLAPEVIDVVSAARTPYRKALQQARDSRHGSNEEQEREARRGRGLASEWNLIGPIRERAGILAFGAGEVGTSRSRGG